MATLLDLGERRILSEIIPKFVPEAGDDCAILAAGNSRIVITTDPVPPPAAAIIGGDSDPYWMGWLLVVINASDLAAAGASPLGFLAAIECPKEFSIPEFERLLSGITDACNSEGLKYVGGNLREADRLAAVGTAVGWTPKRKPLARAGGEAGDLLVSVGSGGRFWRDAMLVRNGEAVEKITSPLYAPKSQLTAMAEISRYGLIHAAMDNSDGLLPTLQELANKNHCTVNLDIDLLKLYNEDDDEKLVKYWMGWGDWNVIAMMDRQHLPEIQRIGLSMGSAVIPIGEVIAGAAVVQLKSGERCVRAPRLESERFARDSWFSEGIEGYISRLETLRLP